MLTYYPQYIAEFSDLNGVNYKVTIETSLADPMVTRLQPAASPCIHKWATDDPFALIKGSSLDFTYINSGTMPLTKFYSNNDTAYLLRLQETDSGRILFTGLLVQDNCSEVLVDYEHEVTLSFTDNLGLLKDVTINNAFEIGDSNKIKSLAYIVYKLLEQTSISLDIVVYNQIRELSNNASRCFIEQIYINVYSFQNSDGTFKNSYEILEDILETFGCTLFQHYNKWHIVNWREAVDYSYSDFVGYEYVYGEYTGSQTELQTLPIGLNESICFTNGYSGSIVRPIKYSKKQFDYISSPAVRNLDLKTLGDLVNTVDRTDYVEKWYDFPINSNWTNTYVSESYIVVETYKVTGLEKERYVLLAADAPQLFASNLNSNSAVKLNEFDVTSGDVLDISMELKEYVTGTGTAPFSFVMGVFLQTDTSEYYALRCGVASPNPAQEYDVEWFLTPFTDIDFTTFPVPNGSFKNYGINIMGLGYDTLYSFSLKEIARGKGDVLPQIPFNGKILIFIYHSINTLTPARGYLPRKLSSLTVDITQSINGNLTITGQKHNTSQSEDIKNNLEKTLKIDDSPRTTIAGTLLLNSKTNLINDRTEIWCDEASTIYTAATVVFGSPAANQVTIDPIPPTPPMIGDSIYFPTGVNAGYYTITNAQQSTPTNVILTLDRDVLAYTEIGYDFRVFQIQAPSLLGGITTFNDFFAARVPRVKIEGNVFGIYEGYYVVSMFQLLNYKYGEYNAMRFIWGMLEIDYRNITANGTLYELYKMNEFKKNVQKNYNFEYIYKTN